MANQRKSEVRLTHSRLLEVLNYDDETGKFYRKFRAGRQAQITVNGRLKYLGQFNDISAAEQVYKIAAEKHFGSFASHLSRQAA